MLRKFWLASSAAILCCFAAQPCLAQAPAGQGLQKSAELAEIRAGSLAFVAAFNQKDAKAVAALWTPDGEYTDDAGRKFQGREAIEMGYAKHFADNPKVKLRLTIDSLRLLSESAAIEDGRAFVEPHTVGAPGVSKYSVVHVKQNGKWLMASVRDTWLPAPSTYDYVADLEWLIGSWTSEDHHVKTESVCRWVANKSFVERSFTTTQPDGATTTGVQIIGFNPQAGHVQSWNFSSDGGHAIGVWSPRENGWTAELQGMTGDGSATSAVNLLTRLDDNAYVWQSIQRTLGETALPDTKEVIFKRSATAR